MNLAGRNMTAVSDVRLHELQHTRLTTDVEALQFDFTKASLDMRRTRMVSMRTLRAGTVHAVAFWFNMELGGGASINTSPDTRDGPRSHWKQAIQLLQDPIQVQAGMTLPFEVSHDPSRISFEYMPA